ncbi:hypothetical protein AHAS_Ahas12G0061300 [Arachis hypogaea]
MVEEAMESVALDDGGPSKRRRVLQQVSGLIIGDFAQFGTNLSSSFGVFPLWYSTYISLT